MDGVVIVLLKEGCIKLCGDEMRLWVGSSYGGVATRARGIAESVVADKAAHAHTLSMNRDRVQLQTLLERDIQL